MSTESDPGVALEMERYELDSEPLYRFAPSRRDLFGMLGAGLVVLVAFPAALAQESGGGRRRNGGGFRGGGGPQNIGAWLHIAESGAITVYTGKVEVGQNTRTALTQAAAEELRVPVGSVTMRSRW
jgi:isoquinoline 1-oxidoreductase